jgi:hypothetical protein
VKLQQSGRLSKLSFFWGNERKTVEGRKRKRGKPLTLFERKKIEIYSKPSKNLQNPSSMHP